MKRIVLVVIFVLAAVLRVGSLAARPFGFTWDEAALGYNAYSLDKTGKDEYGQIMPIVFKSFGDYKPGLYVYLAAPTIRALGLNEFATRLPSAVFGILLVVLIYVLGSLLIGESVGTWAALLLAINPWALQFSRGSWESNVALCLTVIGIILFIRRRFAQAALFFGLTFWTYQGAKLFTPLIIMPLWYYFRPPFKFKTLLWPGIIIIALLLPIVLGLSTQGGRLKVSSVFSYVRAPERVASVADEEKLEISDWRFQIWHAELIDQLRGIEQRYLNYFSPYYLFVAGDWQNLRHSTVYYGYLHWPELLSVAIGLVILARRRDRAAAFIGLWLVLAPVPAALSRDLVSGVRALPEVVPLVLISALGLERLARNKVVMTGMLAALAFFFVYYRDLYYVHTPFVSAGDWVQAYGPAFAKIKQIGTKYDRIVFTDKLGQPYIFALFYLQVDPGQYQSQNKLVLDTSGDVGHVASWGKFEFRPIYWPGDRGSTSTLFFGGEYELPEKDLVGIGNLDDVQNIYYPDGSVALRMVGLK